MSTKKPEKTLEELISRLEELAAMIQSGDIGLEESIALYEEGRRLAKECQERLSVIQKKLEIIAPSELRNDEPPSDDDTPRDLGRDNPILLA
ncbi:MAG: exodeoxyribonuclease VII small subunit [Chloroherpetonaceae bacterium]